MAMFRRNLLPVWVGIIFLSVMFLAGQDSWGPPCTDIDGDGYGIGDTSSCAYPEADCDDTDPEVNPGILEGFYGQPVCSDSIDNDCDGFVDAADDGCDDVVVNFPDPGLEEAVRDEIAKPAGDILVSDLLIMTTLVAVQDYITDLTGLEYCYNLTHLSLHTNWISDLTPLAGLTNLVDLRLFSNRISDLNPLAGLINLDWLLLGGNSISDLTALAGLPNLTLLSLH